MWMTFTCLKEILMANNQLMKCLEIILLLEGGILLETKNIDK